MHLCLFVIVSLPGSINEDQEKSHRPQTLRSLSALYSSTSSQRNISKKLPDPLSEFSEKSLELTDFEEPWIYYFVLTLQNEAK